jgi:hypothetical protein
MSLVYLQLDLQIHEFVTREVNVLIYSFEVYDRRPISKTFHYQTIVTSRIPVQERKFSRLKDAFQCVDNAQTTVGALVGTKVVIPKLQVFSQYLVAVKFSEVKDGMKVIEIEIKDLLINTCLG